MQSIQEAKNFTELNQCYESAIFSITDETRTQQLILQQQSENEIESLKKQKLSKEQYTEAEKSIMENIATSIKSLEADAKKTIVELMESATKQFESLVELKAEECLVPLENGYILSLPNDFTPKEVRIIAELSGEDEQDKASFFVKILKKISDLNLPISIDNVTLESVKDFDIENTKLSKHPLIIKKLDIVISALVFMIRLNDELNSKKK